MSVSVGDQIVLRIEKPVSGGDMLARHDGLIIFVAGALPGELVRVRMDRVARGFAHGVVVDVEEPDRDRREMAVDPACGGRTYAHVRYPRQLTLKQEVIRDAFRRVARLAVADDIAVEPSPEVGYRLRARLQVRDGRIGFVRAGTHEVCDPTATGQLQSGALTALEWLTDWLQSVPAVRVRTVDLAENLAADQRVLHLEADRRPCEAGAAPAVPPSVTGLSWSGPGGDDEVLRGSPYVFDPLGALSASVLPGLEQTPVRRHVRAFFQGNRFLVRDLASAVCQRAGSRGRVLDLYAGVGLYGLALTAAGRRGVTSIEGDRRSGSDLAANVEGLGLPLRVRASSVERYLTSATRSVDLTVILNPPRTGLSKPARTGLVRLRPARIVYVSCDVPTLARDVRVLLDAGWDLSHLQAFDLFPNTPHVETLAVLDRRSG